MFYTNGHSRPITYASYSPRITKPEVLSLEDTKESQIIQILEKHGKKVTNFGGLKIGIAFDSCIIKTGSNGDSYTLAYWRMEGQPQEKFDTFDQLQSRLREMLADPDQDDTQEIKSIEAIFKRHGRSFKNQGWRNKIFFGPRNYIFKKSIYVNSEKEPQNIEKLRETYNIYSVIYFAGSGWTVEAIHEDNAPKPQQKEKLFKKQQFITVDFEKLVLELDLKIMPHCEK